MNNREVTYIYSEHSLEHLKNLIECFTRTFEIKENIDDMFYYGVFCLDETYANYLIYHQLPENIELPPQLTNKCQNECDRLNYISKVISDITTGKIGKPEWMKYIEGNFICGTYDLPPSTFLYVKPKEEKYTCLAKALVNFLYSINGNTRFIYEDINN